MARAIALAAVLALAAACNPFPAVPVAQLSRIAEVSPAPAATASPSPIALPSPPPSPRASAKPVALQPHVDCSKPTFRYFYAQPEGTSVLLSWSVSGACAPAGGFISATYSNAYGEKHWLDPIQGQAGSIVDRPQQFPAGTNPMYCIVNIGYVLVMHGAAVQPLRVANNVRVC